jgi:dUTP pyrophosphatase
MVRVKRMSEDVQMPQHATEGSAARDLRANESCVIGSGGRSLVATGLQFAIPTGWVGVIKSRSGLAVKGMDVGAGVCDSDFRGEVKVLLCNNSLKPFYINKGDRIAQLLVVPHYSHVCWEEVGELDETGRGAGGFGSSGVV